MHQYTRQFHLLHRIYVLFNDNTNNSIGFIEHHKIYV